MVIPTSNTLGGVPFGGNQRHGLADRQKKLMAVECDYSSKMRCRVSIYSPAQLHGDDLIEGRLATDWCADT